MLRIWLTEGIELLCVLCCTCVRTICDGNRDGEMCEMKLGIGMRMGMMGMAIICMMGIYEYRSHVSLFDRPVDISGGTRIRVILYDLVKEEKGRKGTVYSGTFSGRGIQGHYAEKVFRSIDRRQQSGVFSAAGEGIQKY